MITAYSLATLPRFLSLREVAYILSVSRNTVYRLVGQRMLTAYRVSRSLRFNNDDVVMYLETHKKQARYVRS